MRLEVALQEREDVMGWERKVGAVGEEELCVGTQDVDVLVTQAEVCATYTDTKVVSLLLNLYLIY